VGAHPRFRCYLLGESSCVCEILSRELSCHPSALSGRDRGAATEGRPYNVPTGLLIRKSTAFTCGRESGVGYSVRA
jgi:hypothetical protein